MEIAFQLSQLEQGLNSVYVFMGNYYRVKRLVVRTLGGAASWMGYKRLVRSYMKAIL